MLNIGAGIGWPGIHISEASGCHLIALDLPFDAVVAALANLQSVCSGQTCAALVADGESVPLRSASVDAIVHADSF